MTVTIRPMTAADAVRIVPQPSQAAGAPLSLAQGEDLIMRGEAWAVEQNGRLLALTGIYQALTGAVGIAWAILAAELGSAHLAITRHARGRISASALPRIHALVRDGCDAEIMWARLAGLTIAERLPGGNLLMERPR